MFGIGTTELIVICILALILFGNRLPSVMRSLGQGITEFKKGLREEEPSPPASQEPVRSQEPARSSQQPATSAKNAD
ncbi:MAG: twin-arginine translocase TatA/TatE family subunit [Thermoguttaceae bacterium]|nr:twin-arginine translocase TatA/TatE family subunit [Thermoguttaceae bacterium]MDW8037972.1 twin-arginine translocase TatA/TatE family subunit [Thermoguttaceae bacterium]